MISIRKATKDDIPLIIKGILAIESHPISLSDTYSNIFGSDIDTTKEYLNQFFLDDENFDTELSLNTYTIAEVDGIAAGCCALILTNVNYYQNKSELFPIHLKGDHLSSFIHKAKNLPETKSYSENKYLIQYVFVDDLFRGKGVAEFLLKHIISEMKNLTDELYIDVLESSPHLIQYYAKFGFSKYETMEIDTQENKVYPSIKKVILKKNLKD
ncbi:GNAT family N-acetyltransferase [Chryseobacterium sp. PTM-20240506]|uniref:GNAT family N-acetyltransferase n=1 Tax=unclassified Chryseobacterium TaxID=2593645 RepID=UPI002358DE2C|nr:GNAT family N-acetyltransferase [Chryseobacterium sp. B21-037]MDC8106311.1 GNAT family N-acetyltransferase [Chryseobacterium sp. B21-037]